MYVLTIELLKRYKQIMNIEGKLTNEHQNKLLEIIKSNINKLEK